MNKIEYIWYIKNKQGKVISQNSDNVWIAWSLADAILRPDVCRVKYPMKIDILKSEGYYSVEEKQDDWTK